MKNILVIGATSAIAQACIRQWGMDGHQLHLVARDSEKLKILCEDTKIRSQNNCTFKIWNAEDFNSQKNCIQMASECLSTIDICLIAHGYLPEQEECEGSFEKILHSLNVNALSVIHLITYIIEQMKRQGSGILAVISSVAGDRIRRKNYVYGTAKATVSKFLEGVRHSLSNTAIKIIDIKPGLVDTPMTENMVKGLLWSNPEKVAKDIISGIQKNKAVIYTPKFWYFIMLIIKLLPRRIFNRFNF